MWAIFGIHGFEFRLEIHRVYEKFRWEVTQHELKKIMEIESVLFSCELDHLFSPAKKWGE